MKLKSNLLKPADKNPVIEALLKCIKYIIIISGLLNFCIPLLSFENVANDTLSTTLEGISIDADRITSRSQIEYTSSSIIRRYEIERTGIRDISSVLATVPGLYLRDYGGMGGIKTISIRGTSSAQVLVMIDGIKANNAQNSVFDFSRMPLELIDVIEIIKGGASGIFGGSAIGGTVNLITNSTIRDSFSGSLSYGSYENIKAGILYDKDFGSIGISTFAQYNKSQGNYPFDNYQYGNYSLIERSNSDFERIDISLRLNSRIDNTDINLRLISGIFDRGAPGAVVQGSIQSASARLNEKDISLLLSTKTAFLVNELVIQSFYSINETRYKDPYAKSFGEEGADNLYKSKNYIIKGKFKGKVAKIDYSFDTEFSYSDLMGDMLDPSVGSFVGRNQFAISGNFERVFNVSNHMDIYLFSALRYDYLSDSEDAISPLLGLSASNRDIGLKFRSSWSYNFRPPSFNEMYYFNYGTANLLPEKSQSLNIGSKYSPNDLISFSIDGFLTDTKDQIIAVPKSPVSWSAKNFASVYSKGVESAISFYTLRKSLNIDFGYTRQFVEDNDINSPTFGRRIVYVPEEIISCTAAYEYQNFSFHIGLIYTSHRFALPDNSYLSLMPSYYMLDAGIIWNLKLYQNQLTLMFDCYNLTDEGYSVIKNYPMPGRQFQLKLIFKG